MAATITPTATLTRSSATDPPSPAPLPGAYSNGITLSRLKRLSDTTRGGGGGTGARHRYRTQAGALATHNGQHCTRGDTHSRGAPLPSCTSIWTQSSCLWSRYSRTALTPRSAGRGGIRDSVMTTRGPPHEGGNRHKPLSRPPRPPPAPLPFPWMTLTFVCAPVAVASQCHRAHVCEMDDG
jgi:hypothetical protein